MPSEGLNVNASKVPQRKSVRFARTSQSLRIQMQRARMEQLLDRLAMETLSEEEEEEDWDDESDDYLDIRQARWEERMPRKNRKKVGKSSQTEANNNESVTYCNHLSGTTGHVIKRKGGPPTKVTQDHQWCPVCRSEVMPSTSSVESSSTTSSAASSRNAQHTKGYSLVEQLDLPMRSDEELTSLNTREFAQTLLMPFSGCSLRKSEIELIAEISRIGHEACAQIAQSHGLGFLFTFLDTRGPVLDDVTIESGPIATRVDDELNGICPTGLSGLFNIGNSCYFNAAIQVLSNCVPFATFFRHKGSMRPWTMKQPHVSRETAMVIQKIWSHHRSPAISPAILLMRIREEFAQFRGLAQQDAQEVIRCLLELLHRELGQPVYKYEEMPVLNPRDVDMGDEEEGAGDSGMSSDSENSEEHNNKGDSETPIRFRSIVSEVFDGQLESSVRCLTCDTVSTTTETFQDLSLPIPCREQMERISQINLNEENVEKDQPGYMKQAWDYWVSWTNYFSSLVSHSVSLENCLDAFFSPDKLVGDDMYSCEKCRKLRNGVKVCRVSKLPEVLVIHLKRFRHEHFSSSKVFTRVDFPLDGLDMSKWMGKNKKDSMYELTGIIAHEGPGADSGHYIAYCRNELDGNWYEFDDHVVTKLDPSYVMTKEAYVLFYQRTASEELEEKREEVFSMVHPSTNPSYFQKDEEKYYISKDWLERFGTFSNPGKINNFSFLCPHGHVLPRRRYAIQQLVTTISKEVWEKLYEEFRGGPALTSLHTCTVCEPHFKFLCSKRKREWEWYSNIETKVKEAFRKNPEMVYAGHMPMMMISSIWMEQWRNFIHEGHQNYPGPIDNSNLLEQGQDGRPRLKRRPAAQRIHRECFLMLKDIYGGGPEVLDIGGTQPTESQIADWAERVDAAIQQYRAEHAARQAAAVASFAQDRTI